MRPTSATPRAHSASRSIDLGVAGGSDAADGDAPRLAAREQLVRIDFVRPAEEVRLGIVFGAAVDRRIRGHRIARQHTARNLFRAALGLFGRGTLHVAARHSATVPDALSVRNLHKRYGAVR